MPTYFFSAPGRTGISGNHTDHQLAAAVNLETVAEVLVVDDPTIIIRSEGYPSVEIDLHDLEVHPEEANTTKALVRGVAAAFAQRGAFRVHGGGFAGTVQAFVPTDTLGAFKTGVENVFGKDSCHVLSIRPQGGVRLFLK